MNQSRLFTLCAWSRHRSIYLACGQNPTNHIYLPPEPTRRNHLPGCGAALSDQHPVILFSPLYEMTVSLKLESRVAPESKLTYCVLKYTSSKISDLISRKTLVGESKKLFALRCIWDEKSMKAMIGTNSKQLSGCLVFTRLHSQLLPNSKIIFQIMPNCQDLLIFLPFSLFLKSVWWVLKGRKGSENCCWPCCLQSTTGLVAIPQETSDAAVSESARLENGRIMKRTEVKELRAGSPLGWHCLCAFGTQSVFQTHVSI